VGLTQKLTDLEMRRIDLATHYGGEDRKLVALVQEIEEMRQLILKRTQKSLVTWKSLAGTYRKQLVALDKHKVVIDRLKQDIEGLQRVYLLNREKTDEILISKAMDNAVLAGARIVESASANPNPVFPKRMPILFITVFFGVIFGIAYAVILDRLSGKVLSLADVENAAQAPVLASIPEYAGSKVGKVHLLPTALMARDLLPVRVGLSMRQSHETAPFLKTILLVSPSPGAGTSLVGEQLAALLVSNGVTVMLSISKEERLPHSVDWMTACSPDFPPETYMVQDERSGFYRLSVAGVPNQLSAQDNPIEMLLESLRRKGVRNMVVDPGSERGDTQYLKFVPWVTHILLIAAYNRTSKPALARMANVTRRHGGNLVGCLYNRRENVIPEFLYQRLF
jgi:G-rich domain on putative tyrosine kinase